VPLNPQRPFYHPTFQSKTALKMSVVSLLGVEVKNNPAPFDAPYEFEITFECLEQLQKGNICQHGPCETLLMFAQTWNGS